SGDEVLGRPALLRNRTKVLRGRGVRPRAGAASVGLPSLPQRFRRRGWALLRGRGHPPRSGGARGALLRQGVGARVSRGRTPHTAACGHSEAVGVSALVVHSRQVLASKAKSFRWAAAFL